MMEYIPDITYLSKSPILNKEDVIAVMDGRGPYVIDDAPEGDGCASTVVTMGKEAFCETCMKFTGYTTSTKQMTDDIKGTNYTFAGKINACTVCGTAVFVSETADYNARVLYDLAFPESKTNLLQSMNLHCYHCGIDFAISVSQYDFLHRRNGSILFDAQCPECGQYIFEETKGESSP